MDTFFQIAESVVFREVGGQLVVIEAEKGDIYYFSLVSQRYFEVFREPESIQGVLSRCDVQPGTKSASDFVAFIQVLRDFGLIVERDPRSEVAARSAFSFEAPTFLHRDTQKLDEIVLMTCPPSCS